MLIFECVKKYVKVVTIVILVVMFMSCYLINDNEIYNYVPKVLISSINIFSIDGEVYNSTSKYTPFEVYNPNMYGISIDIDGGVYEIDSHDSMRFE